MSEASRSVVKDAAYIFAMEGLCSTDSGVYDNFLDFLMTETDQRCVLPNYFACLFEYNADRARSNLQMFLYNVLSDESKMYLLKGYAQDVKKALEDNDEAQKIFGAFETIQTLTGDEREAALDELME